MNTNPVFIAALLVGLLGGCDHDAPRVMLQSGPARGDYAIVDLSGGPEAAGYPVTFSEQAPASVTGEEYKTSKLILKWIKPGKFNRGGELFAAPIHEVTMTNGFYVALFELTQAQWEYVMGPTEFGFEGNPGHPAESISWEDLRGPVSSYDWPGVLDVDGGSFMGKLSAKVEGLRFDLPSESQWEYACRAGTTTRWSFGDKDEVVDDYAWSSENSDDETQEVGTLQPNPWGLYDVHGNVAEWCLDRHGSYPSESQIDPVGAVTGYSRIWRGGAWDVTSYLTQSADRSGGLPDGRYPHVGCRPIALTTE